MPRVPANFIDDGCSNSPDSLCGTNFRWACRIHDWRYCTRAQPEGTMNKQSRKAADKELRKNLAIALPWYWQPIRWVYYRAVRRFGSLHSYNTCGPSAGNSCRHGLTPPGWMRVQQLHNGWNKILEEV